MCLGDVVGTDRIRTKSPAKIRETGTKTIRGNHDKAATGSMATDDFNPIAKAAVEWTRRAI